MKIDIEDLSVAYQGHTVVAGACLLAASGEITGLVGPNGSGKSTLLRTVYRHLKPVAGRVLLDGTDVRALSAARSARHVAALPQERGGDFELTVREVVAMGRTPYKRAFAGEDAADRELVSRALADVEMTDQAERRFSELSGGERQRVLLARAFAQQPDVLVLDEPTNHLDVRHQVELLGLLRERRRSTLISLHDLNAAAAVCDRLHVLHDGRVVASGPPRTVLTPALLAEVFGVRAAVVEHPLTGDPLIAFDHRRPLAGAQRDGSDRSEQADLPGEAELPGPPDDAQGGRSAVRAAPRTPVRRRS
ncbi:ABC transporter ATP-binding protein [Streptomyces sp. NPDC006992]|uniref:ABC transporter ATP-binding protein n=1 Tax=unclassified Streptomyces TaxID=2593676 RepID=UPI003404213E